MNDLLHRLRHRRILRIVTACLALSLSAWVWGTSPFWMGIGIAAFLCSLDTVVFSSWLLHLAARLAEQ